MDTPQLTPGLLQHAAAALASDNVDAVLGPALDGGYWTIGLKRPDTEVFSGIPMSDADTCRAQCGRLDELGLRWRKLMPLNDVDTFADARLVARIDPGTRFAATLQALLEHPAHHEPPMTEAAPGGRLEIPYG
jgi:glycosyltransferase A (GT-A) superfamily protein (DUF2064 family)